MDENNLVRANKNDNSIKIMIAVIAVLVLMIVALCLYLFVFGKNTPSAEESSEPASAPASGSSGQVSEEPSYVEEIPSEEPFSEPEQISETENSVPETASADTESEETSETAAEPEHGWVINYLGYTYLYKGYGFEQFTFSSNIVSSYTSAVNKLGELGKGKKIYHILVPTNCEFFTIPQSVKTEDDFYCASQKKFMDTVSSRLDDSIKNVDPYSAIELHYDEKLYFNTDPNYTHLGAYYVYQEFCKASGLTPVTLQTYPLYVLNEQFLGKFFNATRSERMLANADQFVYFNVDEVYTLSEKVYRGTGAVSRRGVIFADTGSYNYYTFLGEECKRIDITGAGDESRTALVIGDSAASAFITFLAPHYSKITYINSGIHSDNITELLSGNDYGDIILIHYNTTAGRTLYKDINRLTGTVNE